MALFLHSKIPIYLPRSAVDGYLSRYVPIHTTAINFIMSLFACYQYEDNV